MNPQKAKSRGFNAIHPRLNLSRCILKWPTRGSPLTRVRHSQKSRRAGSAKQSSFCTFCTAALLSLFSHTCFRCSLVIFPPHTVCNGTPWMMKCNNSRTDRVSTGFFARGINRGAQPVSFLPAAKPAGLCFSNVIFLLDIWLGVVHQCRGCASGCVSHNGCIRGCVIL